MTHLLKRFFVSFAVLSVVFWSAGVSAQMDESNTDGAENGEKVTVCHKTGEEGGGQQFIDLEIAKEAVAAHLAHGDQEGHCVVVPPPPVEVVHGEWCSALVGVRSSATLLDNKVVDVDDNGTNDLIDTTLMSNWYGSGDNTACRNSFGPEGEFTQENYLQIDWCNGLLQGLRDSTGSVRGDARFSEIFDVNNDGAVNLSDVPVVAQYISNNDQATCYTHYGFPAWPEEPVLHGEWCSALVGVRSSATLLDNKVVDVDDNGTNDLIDTTLMSNWYGSGDNTACRNSFGPEGEFTQENYLQIDWCNGLVQGLRDHMGAQRGQANFSEIFDVNNDGAINLVDVVIVSGYVGSNNQATCYTHYGFPAWPENPFCGNGIVESGEECDGGEPVSCTTTSGYAGTKSCNMPTPRLFSVAEEPLYCVYNPCVTQEFCGDNIVNGNEQCDAGLEGSETCSTQCTNIEQPGQICGNGVKEGEEACDDGNLHSEMCGDNTVNNGSFCNADCSAIITLSEACDAGPNGSSSCTAQCTAINNPPQPGPSGGGGGGGVVPINIYNIKVQASSTGATITWDTTRQSVTWMLYGLTTTYGDEYQGNNYYLTHTAAITGLTPGTTYHYQIRAKDPNNNSVYDIDRTFTTPTTGGIVPQVLGTKENACVPKIDKDIKTVKKFANGKLIRSCGPEVYLIVQGKKFHIPNWQTLHDSFFAKRIYNVSQEVIDSYEDYVGTVAGLKISK